MELLHNLPRQYRTDPWVIAIADAILGVLEDQDARSRSIRAQISLDTITWALEIEERQAGIVPPAGATLENRRSVLKAKLRSGGKVDIGQIQAVADAWRNGEVEVSFPDGCIHIQFIGSYGVPEDLEGLLAAVREVIPAHLPLDYALRYLLIRDIHLKKTLTEMEALELNEFMGGDNGQLYT